MSAADRAAGLNPVAGVGCPLVDQRDRARAEVELPLESSALLAFLHDIERLFRLNPHLDINAWQNTEGGFRFSAQNDSNGQSVATDVRVESAAAQGMLTLSYARGLKQETVFSVQAGSPLSRLVVTEVYPQVENPEDLRLVEVDRSLVPWVAALRRHLLARARWGWLPGWRWWSERFLLSMPPRQRRIVRMIVWVSVLEFVAFLFVFAIFWLQEQGW